MEPGAIEMVAPGEPEIRWQRVEFPVRSERLEVCRRVVAHTRQVKVGRMGRNERLFC